MGQKDDRSTASIGFNPISSREMRAMIEESRRSTPVITPCVSEREQLEIEKLKAEIAVLKAGEQRHLNEAEYWKAMTAQVGKSPFDMAWSNNPFTKKEEIPADTGDAGAEV